MWMGTYPELPSYVLETGENLQDVINANTIELYGKTVFGKFGKDLPFLPKVLSIAKALPLQLHPVRLYASPSAWKISADDTRTKLLHLNCMKEIQRSSQIRTTSPR